MLRAGCVLLSVWCAINLLIGFVIVIAIVVFNTNAPALPVLFNEMEAHQIDARALATINAIAVFFNAIQAAFCGMCLVVVWVGLWQRARWAYWSLLGTTIYIQAAGLASDYLFFGNRNIVPIAIGAILLLIGFGCSGFAIFRR